MAFIFYILVLLAALPYVSVIEFPMDTTPYFVVFLLFMCIFGFAAVRLSKVRIAVPDLWLIFFLIYFNVLLIFRFVVYADLDSFRVLGNYGSLLLAITFFLLIVKSSAGMQSSFINASGKLLLFISFAYLVASLMQMTSRVTGLVLLSEIIEGLLARGGRTSSMRGFNSLAAEPSYAGIVCSVIGCLSIYLYRLGCIRRKSAMVTVLNSLVTIILSASATVLPFLILFLYYAKTSFKIKVSRFVFIALAIVIPMILVANINFNEVRLFQLAAMTTSNPASITEDVSAVSRFASIINYALPLLAGYNYFGLIFTDVSAAYFQGIINDLGFNSIFSDILLMGIEAEGGGLRTKSAIAQSTFLFGFVAVIFWTLLLSRLAAKQRINNEPVVIVAIIFLGYLIQVPLGHPTILLAIGIILVARKRKNPNLKCVDQATPFIPIDSKEYTNVRR